MFGFPWATHHNRYFPPARREILDRLRRGDLLLHELMQRNEQRFKKRHLLVVAGETHHTIFRLVAGVAARVRILPDGQRQIICFFTPGDLIAVRAVLTERLPDSVEILSNAIFHSLDYRAAIDLAARHGDVAFRLMWQLGEDERRLRNNNVMLARGDAKQRIATMLVDILGRLSVATGNRGILRVISLRQQDVADYLGLTLVHVNRTLRGLREEGAIEVRIGAITVRQPDILFAYATPMLDIYEREAPEFGGRPAPPAP